MGDQEARLLRPQPLLPRLRLPPPLQVKCQRHAMPRHASHRAPSAAAPPRALTRDDRCARCACAAVPVGDDCVLVQPSQDIQRDAARRHGQRRLQHMVRRRQGHALGKGAQRRARTARRQRLPGEFQPARHLEPGCAIAQLQLQALERNPALGTRLGYRLQAPYHCALAGLGWARGLPRLPTRLLACAPPLRQGTASPRS